MIYLAFPGMGKTPLARKDSSFIDLDFGYLREAFNVPKEEESALYPAYAKLIRKYEDDGLIVLINQPDMLKYVHVTKMYLPVHPKRAAVKLSAAISEVEGWINDWAKQAHAASVPVLWVEKGLDHYMATFPSRNTQKRRKK